LLALFVLLTISGLDGRVGYEPHGPPQDYPASQIVPDPRPPFRLDTNRPWNIDLGRGSGMDGLDTVKLSQDGQVILHRPRRVRQWNGYAQVWDTAELTLPPDSVGRIADAVAAERLLDLDRAYHAAVYDGTQWVLWVRQDGREKVVYLNNHFPDPVVRFAAAVDAELVAAGDRVRWRPVPFWEHGSHDDELWASNRR
jgi:hypothetical protein